MISLFVVVVLSYLIGSFPTSILVSKYIKGIDIRDYGSGNAGGTNVLRTLGWKAGISVMLFDVAKGWVAAYYIAQFGYENGLISPLLVQILAGMSSILGHVYTIFAKFKGGKGDVVSLKGASTSKNNNDYSSKNLYFLNNNQSK